MFLRHILVVALVATCFVTHHVNADAEVQSTTEVDVRPDVETSTDFEDNTDAVTDQDGNLVDRANPAVKITAKIIGSLFTGAASSCLGQAAKECRHHWRHAHAATHCAKEFLKRNRGRCATGR